MNDFQLIDAYVNDMEFRELSPETIKVRRFYLAKYAREVGFHGALKDDGTEDVLELRRRLQQWLMRPSLQPQTRALWLTTIHNAYAFANREGYFQRVVARNGALEDFDPTLGLIKPKTKKGKPHPIPEEQLALAVNGADRKTKCWLMLGAICGLRCKEIALLERDVIADDETPPMLHLEHTKGEKPRDVPLFPDVLAALREYGLPESGRLWLDSPAEVSRHGNDYLHELGIKSTMHALRHRAATRIYQSSNDAFYTADILGHSSTEITRIYAKPDTSKAELLAVELAIQTDAA